MVDALVVDREGQRRRRRRRRGGGEGRTRKGLEVRFSKSERSALSPSSTALVHQTHPPLQGAKDTSSSCERTALADRSCPPLRPPRCLAVLLCLPLAGPSSTPLDALPPSNFSSTQLLQNGPPPPPPSTSAGPQNLMPRPRLHRPTPTLPTPTPPPPSRPSARSRSSRTAASSSTSSLTSPTSRSVPIPWPSSDSGPDSFALQFMEVCLGCPPAAERSAAADLA